MAKVSIIMPACNVEKYLRECMDSVIHQTLKDIEIICVDDGSKDSTSEILDEYAKLDSRVQVIHKVNTGYGNSMNVGLDHASGEYVGIIETDDYADLDMFEKLYSKAKEYDADVIKSNYYIYTTTPEPNSKFFEVLKQFKNYDRVFCPLDLQNIYRVRPCIWTGLYRRSMLEDHRVRFNETPGASYQDTAFAFKVWTSADRAVLVKDAYLHYRTDNANSSVKSTSKVFCLCEEYAEMDRFLDMYPEKRERLQKMKNYLKYESYRWNYERLSLEFKYCFLLRMRQELLLAREEGNLDKGLFQDFQWKKLTRILDDTDAFFQESCREELDGKESIQAVLDENKKLRKQNKKLKKQNSDLEQSVSLRVGKTITYIPRKLKKAVKGEK